MAGRDEGEHHQTPSVALLARKILAAKSRSLGDGTSEPEMRTPEPLVRGWLEPVEVASKRAEVGRSEPAKVTSKPVVVGRRGKVGAHAAEPVEIGMGRVADDPVV